MLCKYCNVEFQRKRRGPKPIFCSPRCQNRQWCLDNRSRARELWRNSYWRNRDVKLASIANYRLENLDKVKDCQRKSYKKWVRTEKGKQYNRERAKRYRARKLGADGFHTKDEFISLVVRIDFVCPSCGYLLNSKNLTEDHIVPLSKGGSDSIENIQPLCHPCNAGKKDKTINYLIQ